jgi:hypothetical protein
MAFTEVTPCSRKRQLSGRVGVFSTSERRALSHSCDLRRGYRAPTLALRRPESVALSASHARTRAGPPLEDGYALSALCACCRSVRSITGFPVSATLCGAGVGWWPQAALNRLLGQIFQSSICSTRAGWASGLGPLSAALLCGAGLLDAGYMWGRSLDAGYISWQPPSRG